MKTRKAGELVFFAFGIILYFIAIRQKISTSVAWLGIVFGLILAIRASETAIEGIEGLAVIFGLTSYVAGVLSSLASNTPEVIIGALAVRDGLIEFAVSMVVVATGFNILLVGILIVIGTRKEGYMKVPSEVMSIEVPAMRLTFTMMMVLFALAIAEEAFGHGEAHISWQAALLMITTYLVYLLFILSPRYMKRTEKPKEERIREEEIHGHSKRVIGALLLLGFGGVFFAAEMISGGVEHLVEIGGWGELQIAFIVGMAASLPEHAIALMAAAQGGKEGHDKEHGIELGLGNVLAGALQNLVFIIGIIGFLAVLLTGTGIPMSEFILIQLFFGGILVFQIKSSMTDDHELSLFEGITIVLAQLFVFIIIFEALL